MAGHTNLKVFVVVLSQLIETKPKPQFFLKTETDAVFLRPKTDQK